MTSREEHAARHLIKYGDCVKHWFSMWLEGRLRDIALVPGSFRADSEIHAKLHQYFDEDVPGEPLTQDSIFWYAGQHEPKPEGYGREIGGIFLKDVIAPRIQREALVGLESLHWKDPKRKETKPAIIRQEGNRTSPKELLFGFSTQRRIEYADPNKERGFYHLIPLIQRMDEVFKIVFPEYWRIQAIPKTKEQRHKEAHLRKGRNPNMGGIPARYRLFDTGISTLTLLRSCPAAIHKDSNARGDEANFVMMTSVAGEDDFTGGTFCLLEYGLKIPVRPGHILIAQSTKDWHYNLTAVKGLKYSVVAYYKQRVAYPTISAGPSVLPETIQQQLRDENLAQLADPKQASAFLRDLLEIARKTADPQLRQFLTGRVLDMPRNVTKGYDSAVLADIEKIRGKSSHD